MNQKASKESVTVYSLLFINFLNYSLINFIHETLVHYSLLQAMVMSPGLDSSLSWGYPFEWT